jgi:2-polyprenyl-6-methoxyphenol hydroxylase-like FAD-dependent oxidoreductase
MMRVLISGGGIAGLTLAYWLHQYDIEAVVIERAAPHCSDGYGLDFYGTGYDVAERMGVIDQLRARQFLWDEIAYVNASGKCIAHISIALMYKIMRGRYIPLMHSTLEEVLYQAIADDMQVRHNTTLAAVRPGSDEVAVTFNDGTTDSFDLLIGADGVHSNVRRLVFGKDDQFERYLGYYFASYPLADCYGIGHGWINYVEPGRLASAYSSNKDDEIITLFMYKAPDEGYIPREQRLPRLRKVYAGMKWIAPQLLEAVTDPEHILLDTITQIHMPSWHQGRVALVGDACGCLTLLSGQGASMAMGGAYILAEELHTAPDYASAFQRCEQRMRPPVEQRQKNARGNAGIFLPSSRVGLVVQQLALKLLLRDAWTGLLRQQFGVESLL